MFFSRILCLILLLATVLISSGLSAQTSGQGQTSAPPGEAIERLNAIQESLANKREQLGELQNQLKASEEGSKKTELEEQIAALEQDIKEFNQSFEQIVLGGIDMTVFQEQPSEQTLDWRKELTEIVRPLLDGLKELTEKPRRIDKLRTEINQAEDQLEAISKAQASLQLFVDQTLPKATQEKVNALAAEWRQRQEDTEQALELAHFQLATLLGENTFWLDNASEALGDFFRGRGLTLLLAVSVALGVWLLMRGLFWLYTHKFTRPSQRRQSTRYRLIVYSFRALTAILMILAVLIVLYVAGDLLLLVLLMLVLIGIGLSFKSILPRYLAETKLLLNIGPVREGERLVYNGIPWQVRTLNVYAVLRNPDLEGVLRLPLAYLIDLNSRPSGDEPWFPCNTGDYLFLPDGNFAQVLRQTAELVLLKTLGGMRVQYPTADFLQLGVKNLSRESFGVAVTFGIDYRHQAICLEHVPKRFQEAILDALQQADLNEQVLNLLVDFKEAAASSLDYQIFITFKSEAAPYYYRMQRLVQQTCVAVCNREGWGIPFAQITVHQGEGFEKLLMSSNSSPRP